MTRDEFEALLEEAFIEGYNNAIDEVFDEDSDFDLEEEMDNYNESKNVKNKMDKYRQIDQYGNAYYRNGSKLDRLSSYNTHRAINPGRDWKQYTDQDNDKPMYRVNKHTTSDRAARGRIKVKDNPDELEKIKRIAKIKLNQRKAKIYEDNKRKYKSYKSPVFKNKGNSDTVYDDDEYI